MAGGRGGTPTAPWSGLGLSFRAWALAAVGAHLLIGLVLYEPILHPGGDNAIYMILGEALRTGEGFRDLYLPGEPAHTKYPPLYPALLAVLGLFGGAQLFKLASLALTAGAVWLTAVLGRRLLGEGTALVAAGLLALNPVLLEYSHWALSEALFVALVLLALAWLARAPVHDGEEGKVFAVGVALAVAAFLTRTAGLTLLLAVPLAAWLGGNRRRAGGAAIAGAAAMGAWAAWQRLGPPDQAGYLQELLLVDPYDPAAGTVGLPDLLARTAENVWAYLSAVLPEALTGVSTAEVGGAAVLLGLGVGGLALAGWIERALRGLAAPELFAVLYAGLIAVWPEVWTDRRFLLPLLPLLLLYTVHGAALLGERVGRGLAGGLARREAGEAARGGAGAAAGRGAGGPGRGRTRTSHSAAGAWIGAAVLAGVLALPAARSALALAPDRIRCLAAYRAGAPCDPPAFASLYAAARWAGEHTGGDAVVANRKPSLFWWYGRRKGDVYPFSFEPELVVLGLEEMGADYVVVDQVSATTFRYLLPAVREHRRRFEVVYEGGDPVTLILRFSPPPREARAP